LLGHLAKKGELVVIMDGSEVGRGCCALMLSAVWKGYAIPVVWTARKGPKGHFPDQMHTDLAALLWQLLSTLHPCRVVLLGDGEFDGPLLREWCQSRGWEYVLRTSLDRQVDCGGESARIDTLLPLIGRGGHIFLQYGCGASHAILWRKKGFEDPIPLLTNIDLGAMACKYYKRRFKIETLFRQLKSAGFQLHKSMVGCSERIQKLLIVVAMAFIFTFCIGIIVKKQPCQLVVGFLRFDRMQTMGCITVAQKALDAQSDLAYYIFSMLTKNFHDFLANGS